MFQLRSVNPVNILITSAWFFACAFCVWKFSLFRFNGLKQWMVVLFFALKVFAGGVYVWIHLKYYGGGDTYHYFNDGLIVSSALQHGDWKSWFILCFSASGTHHILPYTDQMSFWWDRGSYLLVRFHAILNPLTHSSYMAQLVIYNFLTLAGISLLWNFLYQFSTEKKWWLVAAFCFPSVIYWTAGVHKDGIILCALGMILWSWHQLSVRRFWFGYFILFGFGCFLIFTARSYLFVILVPLLTGYWLAMWRPGITIAAFLTTTVLFYVALFNLYRIAPAYNVMEILSWKQLEFFDLNHTHTNLPVNRLQSTVVSLGAHIPQALDHCLFRPLPGELTNNLQIPDVVLNLLLLLFLLFALIRSKIPKGPHLALLLMLVFYALSVFILSGSIVQNLGALVRYKMTGVFALLCAGVILMREFAPKEKLIESSEKK